MIYLEEPDYPEYVMHMFNLKYSGTPKHGNMLGISLPVGPAQQTTKYPKIIWLSTIKSTIKVICYTYLVLHKAFPEILQVLISNSMVPVQIMGGIRPNGWGSCLGCLPPSPVMHALYVHAAGKARASALAAMRPTDHLLRI